jgi:hypothetical protein
LTRKLSVIAGFHHGRFTTLRQAVLAHHGEALLERRAFERLPTVEQDGLIEFLKTLQVLRPDDRRSPPLAPEEPDRSASSISSSGP